MSHLNLLRAATLSLAFAAPLAAAPAFAQDQYQDYDYARDVAPHIQAQMNAGRQTEVAKVPTGAVSDAGSGAASVAKPVVERQPTMVCRDATGLTHYGLTAQGGFGGHCW